MPNLHLALTASLLTAASMAQSTWYVDGSAAGPGTGTIGDPYPSIQQAIDAAQVMDGDEVRVASGAYLESLDLNGKSLRLIGDVAAMPVLRGNGLDRLLRVTNGEGPGTEIQHMEFIGGTGGLSGSWGGAVLVQDSEAIFVGCRFLGNRICGGGGGALGSINAQVTIENCAFEENRAGFAGGVYAGGGSLTIRGCRFERNSTLAQSGCSGGNARGGGVGVNSAVLVCTGTTFLQNTGGNGAGLDVESNPGGEVIAGCSFIENLGDNGGGVFGRNCTVTDSLFLRNRGTRGGGAAEGIYRGCEFEGNLAVTGGGVYDADLFDCVFRQNHAIELNSNAPIGGGSAFCTQIGCVFWGNTAVEGAGACHSSGLMDRCTVIGNRGYPDSVAVDGGAILNSIVWGNESISPAGPFTMVDSTVSFSIVEGDPASVPGPPLLFGRYEGDVHLLPGSPAIDAANPGLPLDPDGTRADIGAKIFDPAYRVQGSRFCDAKQTSGGCLPTATLVGFASISGPPARVEATDVPDGTIGILLLSLEAQGIPFFEGTLCVGGSIVRASVRSAVPSSGCGDRLEFPLGASEVALVGAAAGELIFAQVWFRDALNVDGTGVGVSDALVMNVEP